MTTSFFLALFILVTSCSSSKITRNLSSSDYPADSDCEEKRVFGKAEVQKCTLRAGSTNKAFYTFKASGTAEDVQYAHGYLLTEEINSGSIEEMLAYFAREEAGMGNSKWIFTALKECQMKKLKKSASPEFLKNI